MRGLLRKIILWALDDSKEFRALIAGMIPPASPVLSDDEFRAKVLQSLNAVQYQHDPAPLDN
jgi:hypothetical protein